MLIVGFGLMFAAFTVFVAWNVFMRCRERWRRRRERS